MDLLTSLPIRDVTFPWILSRLTVEDLVRLRGVSKLYLEVITDYFMLCTHYDLTKLNSTMDAKAFQLVTKDNSMIKLLRFPDNAKHWLTDDIFISLISRSEKLVTLDLSHCSQLTNQSLLFLAESEVSSQLKQVSFNRCHWIDKRNLEDFVTRTSKLESLNLSSCWSIDDHVISLACVCCPLLRQLDLSNIYSVTDTSLEAVASNCCNMRKLNLRGCWRITNRGIRTVGEYCERLSELQVSECRNITEASLARLRVRGVEIDVMPSQCVSVVSFDNFAHHRPYVNLQI